MSPFFFKKKLYMRLLLEKIEGVFRAERSCCFETHICDCLLIHRPFTPRLRGAPFEENSRVNLEVGDAPLKKIWEEQPHEAGGERCTIWREQPHEFGGGRHTIWGEHPHESRGGRLIRQNPLLIDSFLDLRLFVIMYIYLFQVCRIFQLYIHFI